MNQKRKPLTDAMFDKKTPETPEQLDEIQRRLKATRPQPSRLDAVALQRLADDAAVEAVVERPKDQTSRRAASSRKRRMLGRMLVIAGSWACGATIGACVMFVLMNYREAESDLNKDVVHVEAATPNSISPDPIAEVAAERESELQDDVPAAGKAERRDMSATRFTMMHDPLRQMEWIDMSGGPTLQVGMYFRRNGTQPLRLFERTLEDEREFLRDDDRGRSETWTDSELDLEPRSPVSRQELMEEFLRETTGAVL